MNVQAAGNADSWNQFVRLVAEARTRSQGAAAASGASSRIPAAAVTRKPEASKAPSANSGVARGSTSNEVTRVQSGIVRTVGSFFDAYA
jgi:hypothetical protein